MLPVHIKPLKDEILSSWLVRLAMAHGMKVHSFCSIVFPKISIWNRDIDKSSNSNLIRNLSTSTAVSIKRVKKTTLADSQGFLYETYNKYGPNPWILPVGIYHRKRTQFGMQFCPLCLLEDNTPYFRRRWRLTFMVVCEIHGITLKDRCFNCHSPVSFHRGELGRFHVPLSTSITSCHTCHVDLREYPAGIGDKARNSELIFVKKLLRAMNEGSIKVSQNERVYSILFFQVLHQLMKSLAKNEKRVVKLRNIIMKEASYFSYNSLDEAHSDRRIDIQEQPIDARRDLLFFSDYLLGDWSNRFVRLSQECEIWSSFWLKNMDGSPWKRSKVAPFWFWQKIHENLYRKKYQPTTAETEAAIKHLCNKGMTPSKLAVSRLLGNTYIRRYYLQSKS